MRVILILGTNSCMAVDITWYRRRYIGTFVFLTFALKTRGLSTKRLSQHPRRIHGLVEQRSAQANAHDQASEMRRPE